MRSIGIESVCIFGSAARSSSDQMSDRDVLVVASDRQRRQQLLYHWRKAGWSVADYSPSRLLKMIGAGSLFIQHLKLEGILLRDQGGWLERALQSAERKQSYKSDARASVLLAAPIERFASETLVQQNPIVSDLAYVALRNFGICYLADKGEMVFDYHKIVDSVGNDFGLSPTEMKLVYSLRAGKAAYRGLENWSGISGTVEELRAVLSKFFGHRSLEKIQYGSPVRDLGSGYATLRDFEAAVVMKIQEYESTGITGTPGLKRVRKLIKNPRTYAWEVRNLSQGDLESLRRKLGVCNDPIVRPASAHSEWLASVSA